MSAQEDTKLREAGLLEKFHLIRVDGGFDTCVVSAATYINLTSPNGQLSRQSVLRALRHLVNTHSALSVYATSPSDEKKQDPFEFTFHRLSSIDLNDVLSYDAYPDKPLDQTIHSELEKPLSKTIKHGGSQAPKPLWRVSVLNDRKTVVFAWHHAIGDGGSGLALQRTFLDALNGYIGDEEQGEGEGGESTIVTPPTPTTLPLVLPTESLTSVDVSWWTFFVALYETFAPKSWLKGFTAWTGNLVGRSTFTEEGSNGDTTIPTKTAGDITRVHVRVQTIPGEQGKKLVKTCRENGTTVTAFLHTLAVVVLSDVLQNGEEALEKKWKTFSTSIPVSLRRFTGASSVDMCDHVSNYRFYPAIRPSSSSPTFPWSESASLTNHLKDPRRLESTKEVIGTIRYLFRLGIAGGFFEGQVGKKRGYTFEVSNVGVLPKSREGEVKEEGVRIEQDKQQQDKWAPTSLYFAQNDGTCGAAIKINVAGVAETGMISMVYTWGVEAVEESVVERFVCGMEKGVEAVLA